MKRIKIPANTTTVEACKIAIKAANDTNEIIAFEFNGIETVVGALSDPVDLANEIYRRMQECNAQMTQPILTDEVISAHRLPCSVNFMVSICKHAPKGSRVTRRGEWIVVLKPSDTKES